MPERRFDFIESPEGESVYSSAYELLAKHTQSDIGDEINFEPEVLKTIKDLIDKLTGAVENLSGENVELIKQNEEIKRRLEMAEKVHPLGAQVVKWAQAAKGDLDKIIDAAESQKDSYTAK